MQITCRALSGKRTEIFERIRSSVPLIHLFLITPFVVCGTLKKQLSRVNGARSIIVLAIVDVGSVSCGNSLLLKVSRFFEARNFQE